MNADNNETTLVQQRLHWGIFIPPLFAIVGLFLIAFAVVVALHLIRNTFQQLGPQFTLPLGGFATVTLILPGLLLALVLLAMVWVAYVKSNITLTDRRLVFRTGLFSRVTGELPLENVEMIILAEPVLGRVLGYSTVIVTSLGGLKFPLPYIAAARNFHATLQKAVAGAKTANRSGGSPPPPTNDDSCFMPKR